MKYIAIIAAALALSTAAVNADGKGLPADFWDVPKSLVEYNEEGNGSSPVVPSVYGGPSKSPGFVPSGTCLYLSGVKTAGTADANGYCVTPGSLLDY